MKIEMVMWLHKHMPISIITPITSFQIDLNNREEERKFGQLAGKLDYDYTTYAENNNKTNLLNYLLSFHRQDGGVFENPDGDLFFNVLNGVSGKTVELFKVQKSLFENKNYQALIDAMDNSTLVYSVLELAKDDSFMAFCQANGSELAKLYMDNATYELSFSDPYTFYGYLNDPKLKDKARQPNKNEKDVLKTTGAAKNSAQENSMFNSNRMSYGVGSAADVELVMDLV